MNTLRLDRRIVKPTDCALALAIPVSRQSFEAQLDRPGQGKLVDGCVDWRRYRRNFADRAADLLPRIRRLDVRVETDLTLDGFGRLLREDLDVVILMAHWLEPRPGPEDAAGSVRTQGAVELADGFVEVADAVARIPHDAELFIDLSVCQSEALSVAIKRDRPLCLTRSTPRRRVTPIVWLTFYDVLMHRLRERDSTYLEAIHDVALAFWSQRHGPTA